MYILQVEKGWGETPKPNETSAVHTEEKKLSGPVQERHSPDRQRSVCWNSGIVSQANGLPAEQRGQCSDEPAGGGRWPHRSNEIMNMNMNSDPGTCTYAGSVTHLTVEVEGSMQAGFSLLASSARFSAVPQGVAGCTEGSLVVWIVWTVLLLHGWRNGMSDAGWSVVGNFSDVLGMPEHEYSQKPLMSSWSLLHIFLFSCLMFCFKPGEAA